MISRSSLERSCNENQPLSCPQPGNMGHPKQCSVNSDKWERREAGTTWVHSNPLELTQKRKEGTEWLSARRLKRWGWVGRAEHKYMELMMPAKGWRQEAYLNICQGKEKWRPKVWTIRGNEESAEAVISEIRPSTEMSLTILSAYQANMGYRITLIT